MAYPITHTTAELLDTHVLSTINTVTADPTWLVTDRGEQMFQILAERGSVHSEINDADEVEHDLIVGSTPANAWKYYRGSREASGSQTMGSATSLAVTQNGVFAPARSTIVDVASNFTIPQDLLRRPVQNALNTTDALLMRHMNEFMREQENYFIFGSADGASYDVLAPHLTDQQFGGGTDYSNPSFSLLGLMLAGVGGTAASGTNYSTEAATSQKFMGIDPATEAQWKPYLDIVDNDAGSGKTAFNANDGQDAYEYVTKYIRKTKRYGAGFRPNLFMSTEEMYAEIEAFHRTKSRINDGVQADLASTVGIPIAGVPFIWHDFVEANVAWDAGSATTAVATHPLIGLNTDALRLNMVYGGATEMGWLQEVLPGFQFDTDDTWLVKRLHARFCWSVTDRRSFVYSDRFKDA